MSDRVFGIIGILFAIFYMWQASLIEDSFISDVVGPRTFPYILAIGLAISSLIIALKPDAAVRWPQARQFFELVMTVAVLGIYAWVLPVVGFLLATAVVSGYLTWRLGTKPISSVIFGMTTSLGIYLVFKQLLGLSLAQGLLGF
ncbi:MAG: tripartite tricarboxylate transporter TctB family protein [Alphaproteobacteria bacterium]|nr:tripartite tricarboxylate transporter TctB family protein [Alphaproteobacteria bacterium]